MPGALEAVHADHIDAEASCTLCMPHSYTLVHHKDACSIIMSQRNVHVHVSIYEVAGHRTERALVKCANPPSKGVDATRQCPRVHQK